MIRAYFRVLKVDLSTGRGTIEDIEGRDTWAGGSGLAACLFAKNGHPERGWEDPEQPLIFAIGPLTGYFPLMAKWSPPSNPPTTINLPRATAGAGRPLPCGWPTWMPW